MRKQVDLEEIETNKDFLLCLTFPFQICVPSNSRDKEIFIQKLIGKSLMFTNDMVEKHFFTSR